MNVDNGDQVNGEHHDDNLNPQPEMYRAPRPRRIQHPPDRLTYYGPGEAMPTELFQISVPPAGAEWQPSPLPNAPYPFPPPAVPYYLLSSGPPVFPPAHPYPFPLPNHPTAYPYPYQLPLPNHPTPVHGHLVIPQPIVPQPTY